MDIALALTKMATFTAKEMYHHHLSNKKSGKIIISETIVVEVIMRITLDECNSIGMDETILSLNI